MMVPILSEVSGVLKDKVRVVSCLSSISIGQSSGGKVHVTISLTSHSNYFIFFSI